MAAVTVTVKWIIWLFFGCICWFCLTPTISYFMFKFSKYKHPIIMDKRHQKLTIVLAAFAVINICIEFPLTLLTWTINEKAVDHVDIHHNHTTNTASIVIYYSELICRNMTIHPLSWLLLLKYWLIHFNVEWTKNSLDSKWKIHLNHKKYKQNWYLKHNATYGKLSYTLPRMFLFLSIFVPANIFLTIVIYGNGVAFVTFFNVLLHFFPILAMMVLFFKMRKFKENFHIIQEIGQITMICMLSLIVYGLIGLMSYVGILPLYTRHVCVTVLGTVSLFVTYMVQLWWVMRIIDMENIDSVSVHDSDYDELDFNALGLVLERKESLEPFIEHLCKEWSLEILLAIIEMSQLQNLVKGDIENEEMCTLQSVQQSILSSECIPQSYVVCHESVKQLIDEYGININVEGVEDNIFEFKIKLYLLYRKYIDDISEFQLNISGKDKNKFDSLMNNVDCFINQINMTKYELFTVYSSTVNELIFLLFVSYMRFVSNQNKKDNINDLKLVSDISMSSRSPSKCQL